MINRIHLLQEDLKWQEEFIGEIAKYDRELANNVLVAIAEGDENMIILLQQSGLLEEGIGTAMERGAELGQRANNAVGLSGRVSKFLLLDKPAKAAGAAVGAAAHLMGKDVGGSRSGKKPTETGSGDSGTGSETGSGAGSGDAGGAGGAGGGGGGAGSGGGDGRGDIIINNNATGGSISDSGNSINKIKTDNTNNNINTASTGPMAGRKSGVGGSSTPPPRSGTGSKPPSPESATKDALLKIDPPKTGAPGSDSTEMDNAGLAPGTRGRTETNMDASAASGDSPKIAAATAPKLKLRNRIGSAIKRLGTNPTTSIRDRVTDGMDSIKRQGGVVSTIKNALTSPGSPLGTRRRAGYVDSSIKNSDDTAGRATVGRAATNIAARTGKPTSPETVAGATETTGRIRDTGTSPKEAAGKLSSTLSKYGPNSGSANTLRRLSTPKGPQIDADTLRAGLSGRQNQLPPAQGNKPVPNALDRARGGGPRKIPTNMTPKGRAKLSNQQARNVDPNKGAAGEQMGFGNMYKATDRTARIAAMASRRAPTGR